MGTEENFQQKLITIRHSGEVLPEFIPTKTVKKCEVLTEMSANIMKSSYTPSEGSVGILTYLHLATNQEKQSIALTDRDGTFDNFMFGTTTAYNKVNNLTLQGNLTDPIHVIKGTFGVYNTEGSFTAGSVTIAWEVIKI